MRRRALFHCASLCAALEVVSDFSLIPTGCLEPPWHVSCVFHKVFQEELSSQYFFLEVFGWCPHIQTYQACVRPSLVLGSLLDAFVSIISFNPPGTSEKPEIMLLWGVMDKRFQKGKQSSQGNTVSKRLGSAWSQVTRIDWLCHVTSRHSPVVATYSYGERRTWKPYLLDSEFDSCSSLRGWYGTMSCHLISSSCGFILWKGELQIIHWSEGVRPVVTAQIQQHKWALESKTCPLFTASYCNGVN